tara:strand:- start:860 stop:1135 length:276 start_codon:yes stop_codon:yes gene_type:complete
MNTLTIRVPQLIPGDEVVVDTSVITLIGQTSNTTTVIYTSKTTEGTITLNHDSDPNGLWGDAINQALLTSNSGNAIVVNPSGLSITSVAYA